MGDMVTFGELRGHADWWPVILDRAYMTDSQFQAGCYLDDRAAAGKWDKVFEILNQPSGLINVNQTRPGSPSRSTVLHWAAQNGAPADVVEILIARGAFRSQLDAEGRTAYEIAQKHGRPSILKLLQPPESPLDEPRITDLDRNLETLLDEWLQPRFGKKNLRNLLVYPPVRVLHEAPGQELWSQVPMMSGGFRVILRRGYLEVLLGERRFAESGEVHVSVGCYLITHLGVTPVCQMSGVTWRPGQDEEPTGQDQSNRAPAKDESPGLAWYETSSWVQADIDDGTDCPPGHVAGDSTTYRIFLRTLDTGERVHELWVWSGPAEGSGVLGMMGADLRGQDRAKFLAQHPTLEEARAAAEAIERSRHGA